MQDPRVYGPENDEAPHRTYQDPYP